jgi:hypothetical protein
MSLYTDLKKSVDLSSGCITNVFITFVAGYTVPAVIVSPYLILLIPPLYYN